MGSVAAGGEVVVRVLSAVRFCRPVRIDLGSFTAEEAHSVTPLSVTVDYCS